MSDYQQEYLQQYLQNMALRLQLRELMKENEEISQRLDRLEKTMSVGSPDERKKRMRSLAWQIERNYRCPIDTCAKQYGAEGSLNQHIKLKHPELLKQ